MIKKYIMLIKKIKISFIINTFFILLIIICQSKSNVFGLSPYKKNKKF